MKGTYSLATPLPNTTAGAYERVRGTSYYRLKSDPTVVISNGSMANVRARELGYTSRAERTHERKLYSYDTHLRSAKEMGLTEREFEKRRNDIFKTDKGNDVSPNGELARYLVDIGLRDPDATYNVGETPKKKGK